MVKFGFVNKRNPKKSSICIFLVWPFAIRTHYEFSAVQYLKTGTNALRSKASSDKTSCDKRPHGLKLPTVQKRKHYSDKMFDLQIN